MKLWDEMNEAEREAFMASDAYLDPTNPASVPWGEWSYAAVGAVFRAHQMVKPVAVLRTFDQSWLIIDDPTWSDFAIYRIPPEPKPETVRMTGFECRSGWVFSYKKVCDDTHAITFPTEDGKPVLTKCPHCGTAPIDMEEL